MSNPDVTSRPEAVAARRAEQHLPLRQVNKRVTHGPRWSDLPPLLAGSRRGDSPSARSILDLWCRIYGELVCALPLIQGHFAYGFWIYAANPPISRGSPTLSLAVSGYYSSSLSRYAVSGSLFTYYLNILILPLIILTLFSCPPSLYSYNNNYSYS